MDADEHRPLGRERMPLAKPIVRRYSISHHYDYQRCFFDSVPLQAGTPGHDCIPVQQPLPDTAP